MQAEEVHSQKKAQAVNVIRSLVVAVALGGLPAWAAHYEITELDFVAGLNEAGAVVGAMAIPETGEQHAFVYKHGVLHDLGTLTPGFSSAAYSINSRGDVVGIAGYAFPYGTGVLSEHAFLYSKGVMYDLGTFGGHLSYAWAINNCGDVVGSASFSGNPFSQEHAFLFRDGTMHDLGTLGGQWSIAFDINDRGDIVGVSEAPDALLWKGFVYRHGKMEALGTLDGPGSEARAINNKGQIVGNSWTWEAALELPRAVLWENGVIHDLGTLGGAGSVANGINDRGDIVGSVKYPNGPLVYIERAFLYRNGVMLDLTDLIAQGSGWTLQSASGINNSGQIIGRGLNPKGEWVNFLASPRGLAQTPR